MATRRQRGWEIRESQVTPEAVFRDRRRLLKGLVTGGVALAGGGALAGLAGPSAAKAAGANDIAADRYPAAPNEAFRVEERALTDRKLVEGYNNFFEFGSHKQIAAAAQRLRLRPWEVTIDGLVETPMKLDAEELIGRMALEERVYRHRCVEGWSLTVPWTGFPLADLLAMARPLGSAKYLRMETFEDSSIAGGQRQFWYPWPYVEGLAMAEAANELAFIATGAYGSPMARQNGAPLRLVVPWKYGFKSIKSIVRFSFTEERPVSFWGQIQPDEYGFWANINPEVPHPRWSQATEQPLGTGETVPTMLYNGYAPFVADIYRDLKEENLFI